MTLPGYPGHAPSGKVLLLLLRACAATPAAAPAAWSHASRVLPHLRLRTLLDGRYIYEVMVEPRFQRQGLATHMLRLLEDVAWEQGMDAVVLTEVRSVRFGKG